MSISFRLGLIKSNQIQENQKRILTETHGFDYFVPVDQEEEDSGWIHSSFQEKWIHRLKKPIASKLYESSDLKKFIDAFVDSIFQPQDMFLFSDFFSKHQEILSGNSTHQQDLLFQLTREIEQQEKSLPPTYREYHLLSAPHEGEPFALDAQNNSYDNEMILKILTAAKFGKRDFYIKSMAKLAACFPLELEQDKLDFIQIFSHLFLTKQFPNRNSFYRLCDLLGLHVLTFPHSHYNS